TPTAAVQGRISDLLGKPVEEAPVQLLRVTYNEGGEKILHEAVSTKTNDRGEYRLYGATPGRYYLLAGSLKGSLSTVGAAGANHVQEDHESAYYPGVPDISQASVIELGPGNEINAIDWSLGQQQVYRIRGRVVDGRTGRGSPGVSISMTYLSPADRGTTTYLDAEEMYDPASGSFEIRDVSPGSYVVTVTVSEKAFDSKNKPITLQS